MVGGDSNKLTYNFAASATPYVVDCKATVTDLTVDGDQTYVHDMPNLSVSVNAGA